MATERDAQLVRRAAVHAALGDPSRLQIVDRLAVADASPSQLQDTLGMPSNLVAHHLRTLERAGLVRRIRSEGDRRRCYLSLVTDAMADLGPATRIEAPRIVFVCTENAARSQLAAALWGARGGVPAESAGTHPAPRIHPGAFDAARRHHIGLEPRVPRAIDAVLAEHDLIITVCDRAHEELGPATRHFHWSLPDPARPRPDQRAAYDATVRELTDRIDRLTPAVRPAPGTGIPA